MATSIIDEAKNKQLGAVSVRKIPCVLENFPSFLIVGPQRTGTTWLYHNLKKHPQIYLPQRKESFYFSTLRQTEHKKFHFENIEDYIKIFQPDLQYRLNRHYDALRRHGCFYNPIQIGEATATYATLSSAVRSDIALLNPAMKIIFMLRHPVERAISHAKKDLLRHATGQVSEDEIYDFITKTSQLRLADYRGMIAAWQNQFPAEQIFIGDQREIRRDPTVLILAIQKFLGVKTDKRFVDKKHISEKINQTSYADFSEKLLAEINDRFSEQITFYEEMSADISARRHSD